MARHFVQHEARIVCHVGDRGVLAQDFPISIDANASWSGSLTAQSSHARIALADTATGALLDLDGGWQHYASGTLHYEQQRLFDVPRLRFTLLAGLSTQQLLRRSAGDVDAPLSFVSRSVEARLDYTVGRLEARLSARAARVDDRSVAALIARVTRRF